MIIDYDNESEAINAIIKSTSDFNNVSDRLKNDKKFILDSIDAATNHRVFIYQTLSKELRDDKELLLEILKRVGFAIIHASDRLKNDKEVAIAVFEANPNAIKYLSNKIKEQLKDIKEENIIQHLKYLIKKEAADNLAQELENNNMPQRRIKI
jgi:hypothetical protein